MLIAGVFAASCGELRRVGPGYSERPGTPGPTATPRSLIDIARAGSVRVGFNTGGTGTSLVRYTGTTFTGVNWLIAQEIGRDLGVAVDPVSFSSQSKVLDGGSASLWDIAFIPVDATQPRVVFSNPYLIFDWAYLVPGPSPVRRSADADRTGYRIAVHAETRLDEYLSRSLKFAKVVQTSGGPISVDMVNRGDAEVVGASVSSMSDLLAMLPGGRVLDDPVLRDPWGIAAVKGQTDVQTFVTSWVEQAKATGFLKDVIERSGLRGVTVAPSGP